MPRARAILAEIFASNLADLATNAAYDESVDLKDMIRANLVAERVAIEAYSQMVVMVGDKDPDCRRPMDWRYAGDPRRQALRDFYGKVTRLRRDLTIAQMLPRTTSPIGSGRPATSRSPWAIAATREASRRSRSSMCSGVWSATARSMSSPLAATTSSLRSRSACAMASSAASLAPRVAVPSVMLAVRARLAASCTWVSTLIVGA